MRLACTVAALAWTGGLAAWLAFDPLRDNVIAVLSQARFAGLSAATLAMVAARIAGIALLFAPVAALAVGALRGTDSHWPLRGLRGRLATWLPALAAGVAAAALVRGRDAGGWSMPGTLDLLLPAAGSAFGASVGCALAGGLAGIRRLAVRLAVGTVALGVVAAGVGMLALSREPLLLDIETVPTAEKRDALRTLWRHNPLALPPDVTTTLRLDRRALDVLLKQALALVAGDVRTEVAAGAHGELRFAAGIATSGGHYLNASGALDVTVTGPELLAAHCTLTVGALSLPARLCHLGLRAAYGALRGDRTFGPIVTPLRTLRVAGDGLTATYGRVVLRDDADPALRGLLGPEPAVRDAIAAQYATLVPLLRRERGDAAFLGAVRAAFALAARRTPGSSAVAENQGAILALGALVGHRGVARLAAVDAPGEDIAGSGTVTLHGRNDWARHFAVSAALTQVATARASDQAGLFKEELDADGGSGFSFADLLADRAGTRFGEVATGDEAMAARLQAAVHAATIEDLMPAPGDLPEGLQDAALLARFGGVGGDAFARVVTDIEARLQRSTLYAR
jgi:hypothetical protein